MSFRFSRGLAAAVAAATFAITAFNASHASAAVIVTEIMSSSGTGGTSDWFEIVNTGPGAIDLTAGTGWKIDDNSFAAASAVTLSGVASLPVGTPVIFIEGGASDVETFKTFWGGAASSTTIGYYTGSGIGLSSSGDGLVVFDGASTEVTRVLFGPATSGKSFVYADNGAGTIPTVSVSGQDGAYTSANALGNVGSPGIVPEPTAIAAFVAGLGAIVARRRK